MAIRCTYEFRQSWLSVYLRISSILAIRVLTNGEGELKSTEITEDSKTKSTPSVHFTYESDDESAHSGNGDW